MRYLSGYEPPLLRLVKSELAWLIGNIVIYTLCLNISHNCLMKKDTKMLKQIATCVAMICLILAATAASTAESVGSNQGASVLDYLTDKDGRYSGPTVEENILKMDTDKNGFADVLEVRAFLALKHGKDYEKALLDRWEVHSLGGGCPVPFAKEFLSESKN